MHMNSSQLAVLDKWNRY